jgi:hypothetical protein
MWTYKLHPLYWKFRHEKWTIEQFVERSTRDNVQCKVIAGAKYHAPCTAEILEKATENLTRYFSVVGLSERFEESLALMKLRFGWQLKSYSSFNVTRARPRKADVPRSTLDLIEEKTPLISCSTSAQQTYFRLPSTHTQPKLARSRVSWNRRERELRPRLARRYFRSVRLDGKLLAGSIPVSKSRSHLINSACTQDFGV